MLAATSPTKRKGPRLERSSVTAAYLEGMCTPRSGDAGHAAPPTPATIASRIRPREKRGDIEALLTVHVIVSRRPTAAAFAVIATEAGREVFRQAEIVHRDATDTRRVPQLYVEVGLRAIECIVAHLSGWRRIVVDCDKQVHEIARQLPFDRRICWRHDRIDQQAKPLYAITESLLDTDPVASPERVLLATDASWSDRSQNVGLGWVSLPTSMTAATRCRMRLGHTKAAYANAEIEAILRGLQDVATAFPSLTRGIGAVDVLTDSETAIAVMRRLMRGQDAPQLRSSLKLSLRQVIEGMRVRFTKVKAHTGHPLNEVADSLAVSARRCADASAGIVAEHSILHGINADAIQAASDYLASETVAGGVSEAA